MRLITRSDDEFNSLTKRLVKWVSVVSLLFLALDVVVAPAGVAVVVVVVVSVGAMLSCLRVVGYELARRGLLLYACFR